MINCEECGEEIGTKEEIMEDMVEAHKVERNKTVEILCEGCYHEQPLGSLREDYDAEEGLEFTDWAKQETKHHGKKTSLKDWADHEIKTHGKSMSFQDWAKHEDKSHIRRFGAEGEPEPYEKIWDDYPEPLEDWEIDALQRDLPPREVALDEGTYEWIQENTTEDAFDGIISHITHWFNKYQKCKGQFGAEELKRDSCCCGATKSNPCACMIQGVMECSDTCPCSLWKELREGNWGLNEIGKSKLTPEESERLQIYGAEARVGHYLGEDDELLPVGTKVRSYDFPGIDSSYIEGVIEKIAPSPRCSPDCMHYHIRTTKTVRNGKETNEDGIGEIFMTHPYEDFGWELKLAKHIQVMDAESFEAQAPRGHKMMTAALGKKIPPMDSQEGMGDGAIVYAHYFNPYGIGEWWILEWDGKDEMFGYADLGFPELGYISLSELENVSIGGMELPIERDLHWREKTLGEVKQAVSKYRAESFGAEDHDWEWRRWGEQNRWICKKCEKSYHPPYPHRWKENPTTKGKRKPHKKGCKGQPDPHWLEGKTLKKDGVEKIHDMDEAYYIAYYVIFYHDPKNDEFWMRDDESRPLKELILQAKELEKDGFIVDILTEYEYHPTGEEDVTGEVEAEGEEYTTPCGNCDEEVSWRLFEPEGSPFNQERFNPIFDEDRKVWLHLKCVEGDTESFGAEDEQINIDGQPYTVALGYNYIDNRDGNVGLDYFGLAHNEKDIEGLEKLAIETGKEESEKGEIVGMFLEWEPLCPHLPHEDYSSCPECERGWGIEYGPRYITPCVKCGWDILDNHPYASVFDLDIYVDNLGKYGEKGNLVHLHCATNADVSDEIWDNEGGQFIGKEPDFTKRKIEWGAESFSAPKGKGINLFTEPFEEMALDSGNFKKVIVGIGIGVAGILAYNKWK